MKIAFVTTHMTLMGGGGKFLRDFANKLCEKGHNITIVAQKIDRNKYKFHHKVKLIEIGGPLPSNPIYWINFKRIKKKYLDVLNGLKIDIITSIHFPTNYFCINVVKKDGLKHVHYCLEPYRIFYDKKYYSNASFFKKLLFLIVKFFFKKYDIEGTIGADHIICISKFIRNKVKNIYGRESMLHYLGVEINNYSDKINGFDLHSKLNLKKTPPIIFTLGLTHYMKGSKELIEIFNKILKKIPETILLIGGWIEKQNRKIIVNLMRKLNISSKNVIFYGFIEENLLDFFYAKSILTLYTTIDEPYGLIPLESMKNGTPVIAFEGAGPSETIINGKTGYLIIYGEFNKIARKTINLIKDIELRDSFSKNAREHVRKKFSIEESIEKLESIFTEILSK